MAKLRKGSEMSLVIGHRETKNAPPKGGAFLLFCL